MINQQETAKLTAWVKEARTDLAARLALADYLAESADAHLVKVVLCLAMGFPANSDGYRNLTVREAGIALALDLSQKQALGRAARSALAGLPRAYGVSESVRDRVILDDFTLVTEKQLLDRYRVGPKTIKTLRSILTPLGIVIGSAVGTTPTKS